MKFEITEKGVHGADVGTVLEIPGNTIPAHLVNKGRPVGGSSAKTAVTNPANGAIPDADNEVKTSEGAGEEMTGNEGYVVKDKGRGWFAVMLGGVEVTKSLREDDVSGFDEFSDDDQAAFVAANKSE